MADPAPILLLTRPQAASKAFADRVAGEFGEAVRIVISPLIRVEPVAVSANLDEGAFIFTSPRGVAEAARRVDPTCRKAWCVGPDTKRAAEEAGFTADLAGPNADGLVARLQELRPAGPIHHVGGQHQRGDVAQRLAERGLDVRRVVAYDQIAQPLTAEARAVLDGPTPVIAPLFSPRTAALLSHEVTESPTAHFLCMSDAVAHGAALRKFASLAVIAHPNSDTMYESVAALLRRFIQED